MYEYNFKFLNSSLGRKVVMAITGLFLISIFNCTLRHQFSYFLQRRRNNIQ